MTVTAGLPGVHPAGDHLLHRSSADSVRTGPGSPHSPGRAENVVRSLVERSAATLIHNLEAEFQRQIFELQVENRQLRQQAEHEAAHPGAVNQELWQIPLKTPTPAHDASRSTSKELWQMPLKSSTSAHDASRSTSKDVLEGVMPRVPIAKSPNRLSCDNGSAGLSVPRPRRSIRGPRTSSRNSSSWRSSFMSARSSTLMSVGTRVDDDDLRAIDEEGRLSKLSRNTVATLHFTKEDELNVQILRKLNGEHKTSDLVKQLEKDIACTGKLHNPFRHRASPDMTGASPLEEENSCARNFTKELIAWWGFDALVALVIVANAINIGFSTSYTAQDLEPPDMVIVLEVIFMGIYTMELALRLYAQGWSAVRSAWIQFDVFLLLCGFADLILQASSIEGLMQLFLVRIFRLVRLVRAIRLVGRFRTLWLLVQGVIASLIPIFWIMLLMVTVVYIFAVIGMELILTKEDFGPEYMVAQANFENLGMAMLTLIQFMTLDSAVAIYRPLLVSRPELTPYFVAIFLLGPIALMNVITAVMVESSMRQATEDQEAIKAWEAMKRKQMAPKLKEMFMSLDTDQSGFLEFEEVLNAPSHTLQQLERVCQMEDMEETFKMLDHDGSGAVDINEFINGIMRVQKDVPAELVLLVSQCKDILQHSRQILRAVSGTRSKSL